MNSIKIDEGYFEHPKTLQLIAVTGSDTADIFPLRMWRWACRYRKEGKFLNRTEVEMACKWKGKSGKLIEYLIEAGFLEPDGVTIHDWVNHIGGDIQLYERKKRKTREYYLKKAGINPATIIDSGPKSKDSAGRTPEECQKNAGSIPDSSDSIPVVIPNNSGTNRSEVKRSEGKRIEENRSEVKSPAMVHDLEDLDLYRADEKLCQRYDKLHAEWTRAFPNVNVTHQVIRAHAWEVANPAKQKKDRARFLYNWIARAASSQEESQGSTMTDVRKEFLSKGEVK